MDWLSERRSMFGSSKSKVKTFEEFILKSLIVNSFNAYSRNVTVPIDTKNCTKYVISMAASSLLFGMADSISIDKISDGVITNLFDYKPDRNISYDITPIVQGTSAMTFNFGCIGVIIDPLDLNIFSCDEILRSAAVIAFDSKDDAEDATASIQNPYGKGAKYVIAGWSKTNPISGAKIVKINNDISFVTLAASGDINGLLSGVKKDNSNNGYWNVYCYDSTYTGVSNDKYSEVIYALSFDE